MYYENKISYNGISCLGSHYMQDIPYSVGDTYYTVPPSLENRLDRISLKFYDTVELWWVIALASNIKNPLYVPKNTQLRVPPLSTLFYVKGVSLGRV